MSNNNYITVNNERDIEDLFIDSDNIIRVKPQSMKEYEARYYSEMTQMQSPYYTGVHTFQEQRTEKGI